MKTDGRLSRCFLKGTLGDALFAVLCGCGHNIRKILAHLRALLAAVMTLVLAVLRQAGANRQIPSCRGLIALFRLNLVKKLLKQTATSSSFGRDEGVAAGEKHTYAVGCFGRHA